MSWRTLGPVVRTAAWMAMASSLAASLSCARDPASTSKVRPPPLVVVTSLARKDVPVEVRAPVDLRPMVQADVGSKTLGVLDAVLVDRGDKVKKGQLLALVRPSDLPDQLTAARSTLSQTQSVAALARTDLDRAQALAPRAVVSQQELQQASARYAQAQAAEDSARAQIGALAVRLGETRIVSPMTGVVVQRRLDPGALVGPPGGGLIVTLARVDVLRVFISVNEREIAGLALGQDAHVEVDALPGRSFKGQVVRLAPTLDPGTRTLDAEIQLDNRDGLLRPGMYGRGSIVLGVHAGAMVVPVGAIQVSDNKAFVFAVQGDVVHRRAIRTGVDGGEWLEVTDGLTAGDQVVTVGIDTLAEGMKIRVAAPTVAAVAAGTSAPPVPSKGAAAPPAVAAVPGTNGGSGAAASGK
ncbi:MAG: efflux RND transporter periplasmic adaptor subunit [Myxococcales bacterium]